MNREEYIEILETENAELKHYNKELINQNNLLRLKNVRILNLQQRIDKAIEYIEKEGEHTDCSGEPIYYLDEEQKDELLEILKGE